MSSSTLKISSCSMVPNETDKPGTFWPMQADFTNPLAKQVARIWQINVEAVTSTDYDSSNLSRDFNQVGFNTYNYSQFEEKYKPRQIFKYGDEYLEYGRNSVRLDSNAERSTGRLTGRYQQDGLTKFEQRYSRSHSQPERQQNQDKFVTSKHAKQNHQEQKSNSSIPPNYQLNRSQSDLTECQLPDYYRHQNNPYIDPPKYRQYDRPPKYQETPPKSEPPPKYHAEPPKYSEIIRRQDDLKRTQTPSNLASITPTAREAIRVSSARNQRLQQKTCDVLRCPNNNNNNCNKEEIYCDSSDDSELVLTPKCHGESSKINHHYHGHHNNHHHHHHHNHNHNHNHNHHNYHQQLPPQQQQQQQQIRSGCSGSVILNSSVPCAGGCCSSSSSSNNTSNSNNGVCIGVTSNNGYGGGASPCCELTSTSDKYKSAVESLLKANEAVQGRPVDRSMLKIEKPQSKVVALHGVESIAKSSTDRMKSAQDVVGYVSKHESAKTKANHDSNHGFKVENIKYYGELKGYDFKSYGTIDKPIVTAHEKSHLHGGATEKVSSHEKCHAKLSSGSTSSSSPAIQSYLKVPNVVDRQTEKSPYGEHYYHRSSHSKPQNAYQVYQETKYSYNVSGVPGTPAQASAAAAFFARKIEKTLRDYSKFKMEMGFLIKELAVYIQE
ncbi:hypothetical protein M0802_006358 [Mischocyttarus mexicanus]|nr:hypothetical protein M0802_006358 [Mischocyttarus mexicanus]